MSFGAPLVLIAWVAIPLLAGLYVGEQRRREQAAGAFVSPRMLPSVAPRRPGWRRHVPLAAIALAVAVLIAAAASPRHAVRVPVTDGAVMLTNDISASMAATDITPSRLGAAVEADRRFLATVPSDVRVGLLQFNVTPAVLQSPTTQRDPTLAALTELARVRPHGHTDIGTAIQDETQILTRQRGANGKRVPSAIVLLSDGGSTGGVSPVTAAQQAKSQHIPIYTIALGTQHGTIAVGRRSVPVPLEPAALEQIAQASGGRSYTVGDAGTLQAVYAHLAAQLGHRTVQHALTATFAGIGLLLLVAGTGPSLLWFGRLI